MKKILTLCIFTSALTSCGSGGAEAAAKADSAVTTTIDSTAKIVDSAAAKVDSTIKAAADTVKVKAGAVTNGAKKDSK